MRVPAPESSPDRDLVVITTKSLRDPFETSMRPISGMDTRSAVGDSPVRYTGGQRGHTAGPQLHPTDGPVADGDHRLGGQRQRHRVLDDSGLDLDPQVARLVLVGRAGQLLDQLEELARAADQYEDRKSTRLNS